MPRPRKFALKSAIPAMLPIDWEAWNADKHIQDMNETMEGIYFRIIRELWVTGSVVFDHNRLAERLHCDRRNVLKFLENYSHLFTCINCGGRADYASCLTRASSMSQSCSTLAPSTSHPCSNDVSSMSMSCSLCVPTTFQVCLCHVSVVSHSKLSSYRKDIDSHNPLGTLKYRKTQHNITGHNKTQHKYDESMDEVENFPEGYIGEPNFEQP